MKSYQYAHLYTAEILSRAYGYANDRSITKLDVVDNFINATVVGNTTYSVRLTVSSDGVVSSAECSCPYDGYCKHSAAVMLLLDEKYLSYMQRSK